LSSRFEPVAGEKAPTLTDWFARRCPGCFVSSPVWWLCLPFLSFSHSCRLTSVYGDDLGLGHHDPPAFIYDSTKGIVIPPQGRVVVSVTCAPAELGVYKMGLVLSFSSFQLGRLLTARCVPDDGSIMRELATTSAYVPATTRHAIRLPVSSTAVVDEGRRRKLPPGRKPWPRPRMGNHPLAPPSVYRKVLGRAQLTPKSYGAYHHALLYAEEEQVNTTAHEQQGITLTRWPGKELLQIVVPGVATLHPGVLLGDRIIAKLCGAHNTPDNVRKLSHKVSLMLPQAHNLFYLISKNLGQKADFRPSVSAN